MLMKTIRYTDFNDIEQVKDFYFNMTKAELMKMEIVTPGGMENMLKRIVNERDNRRLLEIFEDIIAKSYGVKSPDGQEFEKSPEITKKFMQTNAYSELFMELIGNGAAAADFINGVIPQAMAKEIDVEARRKIAAEIELKLGGTPSTAISNPA